MNLRHQTLDLLRAVATLHEPFTTRDVESIANCKSSVCHHLQRWAKEGWIEVIVAGGRGKLKATQRTHRRTPSFPTPATLQSHAEPEPPITQTETEKRYWEFRNSLNIKTPDEFDAELTGRTN